MVTAARDMVSADAAFAVVVVAEPGPVQSDAILYDGVADKAVATASETVTTGALAITAQAAPPPFMRLAVIFFQIEILLNPACVVPSNIVEVNLNATTVGINVNAATQVIVVLKVTAVALVPKQKGGWQVPERALTPFIHHP